MKQIGRASNRSISIAALVVALIALVVSTTGVSQAVFDGAFSAKKARPGSVVRLNGKSKIPASLVPKVRSARKADKLGGKRLKDLIGNCAPNTVDFGSWCLMNAPFSIADNEIGKNNYFFATQKCVDAGGRLATADELIGAAARVKLASTIGDSQLTASIDLDKTDGLKDRREMSATLVTTAAGSTAAGSEGVTEGSRGDPKQGEPDPIPVPANPSPETLQYVTVYDNGDKGGFGGSKSVATPENFRCAFDKQQGKVSEVG